MNFKKIIALIISSTLFFIPFNALTFAKNKNLDLDKIILDEMKEENENLKNTIIQVNNLLNNVKLTYSFFNTLEDGILKIGFDEENKKLKVFDIKRTYFSHESIEEKYFELKILDSSWRTKKEIAFKGDDVASWGKENEINNFQYDYGDVLTLWVAIPQALYIHGKVSGLSEDYPYIIPNTVNSYSFKITKEGLKPLVMPPKLNESLTNNIIEVRCKYWKLSSYLRWLVYSFDGFKIIFDENKKQLKVKDKKQHYYLNEDIGYEKYFQIKIFNKNLQEKLNIELNGYDLGTTSKLDQLNNFKYEYGDIIKLWCESPINQRILGKVLDATGDYSKGMKYIENLEELAFEITPKGLKEISNRSPHITGAEDITIRKGTPFDKMKNISAKDDNDGDVTKNLTIIGDVNINELGIYNLIYKVSDSKNKITKKIRKVTVIDIPKLEKNKITVLGLGNDEKFKIEFDDLKKEFKIKDRQNSQLNSFLNKTNYFSFYLLDKNYKEKVSVNLNGDDLAISDKLNELENFKYEYGDIIKLHHSEPNRLKITGDIIDKKEDYLDGVNNKDNIENVYFQITEEGLKSIYNEAPIILGINDVILKVGEAFDPLEGVVVSDDYDKDLVPIIKGTVDTNTAGNYSLTYTVRDSMGREVNIVRNITVRTNEAPVLTGNDDITILCGDKFDKLFGVKAIDKEDLDLTNSIIVTGDVDTTKPGIYKLNYSVEDSDGNITQDIRLINVKSNNKPILKGTNNLTIKINDAFDPLEGVTAMDHEDLDLTDSINVKGIVDTGKLGNYDLIYSVKDSDNNETIATRRVTVRSNEKPIIKGTDDIVIKVGDAFNPLLKVIAEDIEDKDLTNKIIFNNTVNTSKEGVYSLIYLVEDSDGNITKSIRNVTVKSNAKPKLTGLNDATIPLGEAFNPYLSVTALDKEDGDISHEIKIKGTVDINTVGQYQLIYSIKDDDDNETLGKRIITVRSNEKPIIDCSKVVLLKVGDIFNPLEGVEVTDKEDGDLKKSLTIEGDINTNIPNEYDLTYSVTDSDGNEAHFKRKIIVRTNEKPIIIGANDVSIKVNEIFDKLHGVKAHDTEDGDITQSLIVNGNIDNTTMGNYNLIYSITDKDGNVTEKSRRVFVRSNEKPTITGIDTITIKIGDKFNNLLGVNAYDKEDGDLTEKINVTGNVDTAKEGVYTLTYSVEDIDGNISSVRRRIKVRSNDKPQIIGAHNINLKINTPFDSLKDVFATDAEDGDLTKNLLIEGTVNTSKLGDYELIYSIIDSDGNKTIKNRKVIVQSNEKPIINGVNNKILKIGEAFDPLYGITSTDLEDNDLTKNIILSGSVNNNIKGEYVLTYSVTDSDGNTSEVERIVTVETNTKPEIFGAQDTTIKIGDNFENTSSAILAMDAEDGDITNLVSVKGNVDNTTAGKYTLVYSVTDKDGNSTTAERKVIVKSNDNPIIIDTNNSIVRLGDSIDLLKGITAYDTEDGDLTKDLLVTGTVDTSTEGKYKLIYSITDKDGNKVEKIRKVIVKSNEKPVIKGADAITIKIGDNFHANLGITAYDKEDGDLTKSINITGNVDTTKEDVYTLIYSVNDSDGNISSVRRRIKVRSNNKPEIIGVNTLTLKVNTPFHAKKDIIAKDTEDGDLTDKIIVTGSVDTSKVGEYLLIYTILDSDGNKSFVNRKVIVQSNEKPIINNVNNKIIKIGDSFDPLEGITATDFEDKDLTNKILITGNVDTLKKGKYILTYSITDKDGNTSVEERAITVVTNNKPKIFGTQDTIIKVGDNFESTSSAILAMDEEDGDLTKLVSVKGTVDTNTPGEYKLIYSVTDKDLNTTTAERKVIVKSNDKPIIIDANDSIIKLGDSIDLLKGITAHDTEDGDLTKNLIVIGSVDTSTKGEYKLVYSITDKDGNKVEKIRKVIVKSNEKPVITGADAITIKIGDNFDPNLSVTAYDKEDGDLTKIINITGNVDTTKEDLYTLIYSVEDRDGNISSIRRRVRVRSNNKPQILGIHTLILKVNTPFDPKKDIIARDTEDGDLTDKIIVTGTVNTSKVGEYLLTYTILDSDGNKSFVNRKIIIQSNEKPILNNVNNKVIKIGDVFNPLEGITATDFEDKDLTNKILITGSVNNSKKGHYTLNYSVTDSDGNTSTAKRIITVKTNSKPEIFGTQDTIIKVGDNFENTSLAILAMDEEDGDITNLVSVKGTVDANTPGEYKLIYSVTDKDLNTTITERKVIVRSNDKPVFNGIKDLTIKVGDVFNPLTHITVLDKEDGDITNKINIKGKVHTYSPGIYEIIYSVEDSDNNIVFNSSLITVESNEKPKLLNVEDQIIKQGDSFNAYDDGIIALDKEDGDLTSKINVEGTVNTTIVGEYILTYCVEDTDGNITKAPKKIIVRSNTPPIIEGISNITLKVGEHFNPMNKVTAKDVENGDLTNLIKIEGKVDTSKPGLYKLKYHIHDNDGNTISQLRDVIVRSNDKPIIKGIKNLSIKVGDNVNYYLGVEAFDTEDGRLTDKIELEGEVNENLVGEYSLIYKVTDSDENETRIKKIITVRSNEKPILQGIYDVEIKANEIFDPLQGVSAIDKEDGDLTNIIEIDGKVNINKSGLYTLIYKVKDKDDNLTKDIRKILVKSNEKPVILGAKDITMKQHERFNYTIGIKAIDKEDGDLTNSIKIEGKVDCSAVGDYKLTYSIVDKDGNETSNNIKVSVKSNESPIIEEKEKIILKVGDKFNYIYGINAFDKEDGDISHLLKISEEVDTGNLGIYNITYSVVDSDGNKSTFIRKVTVKSNEKPKIYGNENIDLILGESFSSLEGIVANDTEDGDLTKRLIVKGFLNITKIGSYDLIYSVIDNDGNETIVTRRITVKNINNIEILGINNIEIPYGEPFDYMKGIKAIDSENRDLTSSIIIEGNVDVNKIGNYTLIYNIKNENEEKVKFFRVIRVIKVKNAEEFKKLPLKSESIIKDFLTPKIIKNISEKFNTNIEKYSIEMRENKEKIIENELVLVPKSDDLKEELNKFNKNEEFIRIYKDNILPPKDTKTLPLWLFGIILISLGKKILKKEE